MKRIKKISKELKKHNRTFIYQDYTDNKIKDIYLNIRKYLHRKKTFRYK